MSKLNTFLLHSKLNYAFIKFSIVPNTVQSKNVKTEKTKFSTSKMSGSNVQYIRMMAIDVLAHFGQLYYTLTHTFVLTHFQLLLSYINYIKSNHLYFMHTYFNIFNKHT